MSQQQNDTTGVAVEDKALDKESVIELLGEDDKEQETIELEEPAKGRKEDKTKGDKTEKETPEGDEKEELSLEDELEDELQEPDDDKLELTELPSRKEILTAYPDLFKKFPQLEKSMYREKAYSELLPTIQDAKVAVQKAELLDEYHKEFTKGSVELSLSTIKGSDKEAFARTVDDYMPALLRIDQDAYYHVIGNLIKHTVISMVNDARSDGDDDLSAAAAVLNKYVFGTTKFTHPTKMSKDDVRNDESKEKEVEISRRERALVERQFTSARDDLGVRIDGILKNSVDKAIDPNESMSGYVKDIATGKVLKGLEGLISRDNRFKAIYDKLWEKAFENDFDKESMDKIRKAYLSKAQTLLPLLIKKERNEALKGNRRASDEKDRRGPLPVGKTRSSTTLASGKSNSNNGAKQIPKGMSTLDYLNSED